MKTFIAVLVVIILAGGAWWYMQNSATPMADTTPMPSGTAGINGSPNQGNMGQPDNGTVQQPGADGAEGSIIGSNLALGTNASAALGTYLIAYNGMTVYQYTGRQEILSRDVWPPYLVGAEDNVQQLKAGVNGKVDTIIRTDGGIQVTYNGHPLYFYMQDKASGDVKGQNVGGVWFVVKP